MADASITAMMLIKMNNIHSTAIVSSKAELGNNIHIGPYCIINENVKINDNCSFS